MSTFQNKEDGISHSYQSRRTLLKTGFASMVWLLSAGPLYAFTDLFKILDPEGKNKDIQNIKKILEGAGSIAASGKDLDYKSEFAIGESLALEGFHRYGLPIEDPGFQKYVNMVGTAVARNSRRPDIPYYFVVVKSKLYNAFSCPGGIIFVSSALVSGMNDEAELACILAHEVAHVGYKHALKTLKRAEFFEGISKITTATMKGKKGKEFQQMIGDLQTRLFDKGLDQTMEFEADISSMETAYRTGYDPEGLLRVLRMLETKKARAEKKGSWFSTHPPLFMRIERCRRQMNAYPDAESLSRVGHRFLKYIGRL